MPFKFTVDHISNAPVSDASSSESPTSQSQADDGSYRTGQGSSPPIPPSTGGRSYSERSKPIEEGSWTHTSPDEIGPSDSASQPQTPDRRCSSRRKAVEPGSRRRRPPREPMKDRPHLQGRGLPPQSDLDNIKDHYSWLPTGYVRGSRPDNSSPASQYDPATDHASQQTPFPVLTPSQWPAVRPTPPHIYPAPGPQPPYWSPQFGSSAYSASWPYPQYVTSTSIQQHPVPYPQQFQPIPSLQQQLVNYLPVSLSLPYAATCPVPGTIAYQHVSQQAGDPQAHGIRTSANALWPQLKVPATQAVIGGDQFARLSVRDGEDPQYLATANDLTIHRSRKLIVIKDIECSSTDQTVQQAYLCIFSRPLISRATLRPRMSLLLVTLLLIIGLPVRVNTGARMASSAVKGICRKLVGLVCLTTSHLWLQPQSRQRR